MKTRGTPPNQTGFPDVLTAYYGGVVKALGEGKFRAPLVTFSSDAQPDLTGDFFDASTKFWRSFPSEIPLLYGHAQDPTLKSTQIGVGGVATLTQDASGIWMEGQMNLANQYEAAIYGMIEAGKMGTSSGSAPHLVQREAVGKAFKISSWPLVEGSLTPTPAEPRNVCVPLKSIKSSLLGLYGSWRWSNGDYGMEDVTWDPAEAMTCAAASQINYRLMDAVENIIAADGMTAAEKGDAFRAVAAEYAEILATAMEALLALSDEDATTKALDVAKAITGRGFKPGSIKDFERFLRDAGSFSRKEATAIASSGYKAAQSDSAAPGSTSIDDRRNAARLELARHDHALLVAKTAAMSAGDEQK